MALANQGTRGHTYSRAISWLVKAEGPTWVPVGSIQMAAKKRSDIAVMNEPSRSISPSYEERATAHEEEGEISNYLDGWPLHAATFAYEFFKLAGHEHSDN